MAVEIKFLIDNLDRGQPLNPEDFGINITEDSNIGARIVSFDNELIFGGDVFGYLYNKLATSGYCELVRVTVQYICSEGTWEHLVDGYLIVTESVFDLDKCQVKTKVYDETFSTKINNNKGIPFSMSLSLSKNGTQITPPTIRPLVLFNPATGNYDPNTAFGVAVYDAFAHLVNCMSDGLIDFDSNLFAYSFPTNDVTVLTVGLSVRNLLQQDIVVSFEQLYLAMKQKLNLGMGFEKQANGRPLLRIEPIAYFQQSNPTVNLYDQPEIEMKFDTTRLYAAAEFGGNPFLEQGQCDSGNTQCTFNQTPFRGFRTETFGFVGECNTSNILRLKTEDVIFDTNVIEDMYRFNVENYDTNPVIIQSAFNNTIAAGYAAKQYDPYNIGQTVYNGVFTNDSVSGNWISGYPNSLFSFLEQPFTQNDTSFYVVRPASGATTVAFETNTAYTSYSGYNGNFVTWIDSVDPNNLFNSSTYTVPFTGVYVFEVLYCIRFFPQVFDKYAFCSINHFDALGNPLATYNSGVTFIAGSGVSAGIMQITKNQTFVCNAGDLVRTDVSAKSSFTGGNTDIYLHPVLTFNGVPVTSYFQGFGLPLAPPELEAVDINDVQAYLYKFKRPLSMAEINAITSETSKPIQLGRKDDSIAVIDTYIKNIQIESVMRKNAQFELRSNKLLP